MFVNVIDAHQRAGEGGDFPERDEERFMDLPFRVNKDSAKEENETSGGEHCGYYQLDVNLHNARYFSKFGANICRFLRISVGILPNTCYGGRFLRKILRICSSERLNRSPNSRYIFITGILPYNSPAACRIRA